MKYSSHLYLRTDGSLGRFPIIEVDADGLITSVVECGDTLREVASTRFFAGVIVPCFLSDDEISTVKFTFANREEFVQKITDQLTLIAQKKGSWQSVSLAVGMRTSLMLISGFDLNTFNGEQNVHIQRLN